MNQIYLDPFHGGKVLSVQDCGDLVRDLTQGSVPFQQSFLDPVDTRYVLTRMLNNLKNIYTNAKNYARARHIIERLLALNPRNYEEMRNLGLLYAAMSQPRKAVEILEQYMLAAPDASDATEVRKYVSALTHHISRWN